MSFIIFIWFLLDGLSLTGLWKYSLYRYVEKEKVEYVKFAKEIDKISNKNLEYISCFDNEINSRPSLDSSEEESIKEPICNYFKMLDCVEVSLDRSEGKYLFVMSRFIDNGYGLLYCKNEIDIDSIYNERINGLEVRSVVKVDKHWYYIGFT
ncbi:MAG TPA: hypothetical protein PKD18_02110 [Saprospiraceae bacterium]|nr:hypothetical protein [Saprospiraceae bacterium]